MMDKLIDKLVPPTDNLYKFQTLLGLLLMAGMVAGWYILNRQEIARYTQVFEKHHQELREFKQKSDARADKYLADHEKLLAKFNLHSAAADSERSAVLVERTQFSAELERLTIDAQLLITEVQQTAKEPA